MNGAKVRLRIRSRISRYLGEYVILDVCVLMRMIQIYLMPLFLNELIFRRFVMVYILSVIEV